MPSDLSSPEERRALAQLGRLIGCDIRPRALLRLARHGPANVGDLARALGFNAANLGDHLGQMSDLGLLFRNRDGKYHRFEINPARVRCGRMGGGAGGAEDGDPPEDFLRINSRPGGLAMIIVMPATQHRVPASSEEKNAV